MSELQNRPSIHSELAILHEYTELPLEILEDKHTYYDSLRIDPALSERSRADVAAVVAVDSYEGNGMSRDDMWPEQDQKSIKVERDTPYLAFQYIKSVGMDVFDTVRLIELLSADIEKQSQDLVKAGDVS